MREEERQAWQRLIRVLGHELNNSLAPIKSVAGSLESLIVKQPKPSDWEEDMRRGLAVIATRSDALGRFMGAYSRLARLPRPSPQPLDVGSWIRRVTRLETQAEILLTPGPEITIRADGDQLDQLLINLLRNAVEAARETQGQVMVGWKARPSYVELCIEDEGPGLPNTHNLFVPFYTTKPQGSGIGCLICTELMFNEHARRYGREGAHVIAVPRAVGKSSLPRWLVAMRMAAIVSRCYVLSSNRSGVDSRGQLFVGCGWVIDPLGDPVAQTSAENPVVFYDLRMDLVATAQGEYPYY